MILFDCFAISEPGKAHETSHDFVVLDQEARAFVVADGISGHPGGAAASKIAVETFLAHLKGKELSGGRAGDVLLQAVLTADQRVRQAGQADPLVTGMGTTLSALVLSGHDAHVVHVGNSRIYRLRQGELHRLTVDHTLVAELVRGQHIQPEVVSTHPLRNVLTQSLGAGEWLDPQLLDLDLAHGDLFILVTDGLEKVMDEGRLLALIREHQTETSEWLCCCLVADAMAHSPTDDLTLAVVKICLRQGDQGGAS